MLFIKQNQAKETAIERGYYFGRLQRKPVPSLSLSLNRAQDTILQKSLPLPRPETAFEVELRAQAFGAVRLGISAFSFYRGQENHLAGAWHAGYCSLCPQLGVRGVVVKTAKSSSIAVSKLAA